MAVGHTPAVRDGSVGEAEGRIGAILAGKYRLDRILGKGSIGCVYAAVHQFTGKHVALKILDRRMASQDGYATRFLREARAAAEIGHPSICDVIDAGQEPDGTLYLALELLEGRTLGQAIDGSELSLEEIAEVGAQLLEGLAAAHDRGIVHRDIKPENIFLTWDERGELNIKLLDFGVAKHTRAGPEVFSTQQGAVLGTPYYMSPEQAAGDPVDTRADIWSVGAVLFHALTGRPPYDETTYNRLITKLLSQSPPRLREIRQDVPEWLATVVDGALVRRPEDRYQSARTMAESLRLRGEAPMALDWELHEDATVRTDSPFAPPEEPSSMGLIAPDHGPSVLVEDFDIDVQTVVDTGPTAQDTDASLRPPRPRSGLWLGVLLGALFTAVLALGAGYLLLRAFEPLAPLTAPLPAEPVELPPPTDPR